MKNIFKVVLVALIGLGSITAVQAGDPENCWGRCDTDAAQNHTLPAWWVNAMRADNGDDDEPETMASYH